MPEIPLKGCTPAPLAGYLKALGVFRLLAEQKCAGITACWNGDTFQLEGPLDMEEVIHFFQTEYKPTPILAPWNGGSGFHPGDNQEGFGPLSLSTCERFAPIAESIHLGKRVLSHMQLSAKPDKDQKPGLLQHMRNEANEALLTWLDAAVVLTGGDPSYPPLLGTGGNDGHLDFTNNYLQHLVLLFDPESGVAKASSVSLLSQSLTGVATPHLLRKSIGQFSPGQAGGANATSGFSAFSLMNPWDFVLMLEGSLLLATGATRRLESASQATLSYPFMVYASGGGSGGLGANDAQGKSRGEIWLPLWNRRAGLQELHALFSEGRVTVGRRPARDGLDFARALGQLGVSRGIAAFERYGFLVRNGLSYLATPLGRFTCGLNPRTTLMVDLETGGFLDALRREARGDKCPASLKRSVSRLEACLFALSFPGSGTGQVQRTLCALGSVMHTLARSPGLQKTLTRLPELSSRWVEEATDDSPEFRIALAVASLAGIRSYLYPMDHEKGRWVWNRESRRCVWHAGPLAENLARLAERRVLEAERRPAEADPFLASPRLGASMAALSVLYHGQCDTGLLADLLSGLVFCKLPESIARIQSSIDPDPLPVGVAVLKPFFSPGRQLHFLGRLEPSRTLGSTAELIRLLAADRCLRATDLAWRRARIAGMGWPKGPAPAVTHTDGHTLLAVLCVPLENGELARLLPPRRIESNNSLSNQE
jgi:CRISPR-associated protein Csx17